TEAAAALRRLGAGKIYAFASHALLSGPAVERLRASPIDEVAVTNTIRIPDERCFEKLKVLSIAGLIAKAIGYEHSNQSVSTIIELAVDGMKTRTLIREIQRHPIRPDIIHVDFYEIHAEEKVKLKVPVHLVGNPDGVRNAGGVLDQVTREVEIEVMPDNIPDRVELDVTALKIGDSLHVGGLHIAHPPTL